ncbi:MAG TPA: DUF58 domain-containing protein [Lunatimonas sp.]|nr:DUF58 domain-containing protein [Lunatimonas sp.]
MSMVHFFRSLYLSPRPFYLLSGIGLLFMLSYWVTFLYTLSVILLWLLLLATLGDAVWLFAPSKGITSNRFLPDKLSNGDPNPVSVQVTSGYRFPINLEIIDELPVQFQNRDFLLKQRLERFETRQLFYEVTPLQRGNYVFGYLHVYICSQLGLIRRRFSFDQGQSVKVYPSFIQMRKFDFLASDKKNLSYGVKRIRRLGHSMEFDRIKDYVAGDDVRAVNWKATAKQSELMVNQFQTEKSQPIYLLIDTGRVMKMPFGGMTLLDYAINSSLAFANLALKKKDKVGMISFSNGIHQALPASNSRSQLRGLSEALYPIATQFHDTDFGILYGTVKRKVPQRSLLILFTNFEHVGGLKRQFPFLQGLARKHLLVVVIFQNTEMQKLLESPAADLSAIYRKTVAQKFDLEKRQMVLELGKRGIQAILTPPEELTVNAINKYVEIKARGML